MVLEHTPSNLKGLPCNIGREFFLFMAHSPPFSLPLFPSLSLCPSVSLSLSHTNTFMNSQSTLVVHTHIQVLCLQRHMHTHACIATGMHTSVHTHICTHTHACTHIHAQRHTLLPVHFGFVYSKSRPLSVETLKSGGRLGVVAHTLIPALGRQRQADF